MPFSLEGGSKHFTMTDHKYKGGGGEWITELQVMRMCTMHDDENVSRAMAGFSWIRSNS